ncbi:MAG: hypothetical protein K9M98_10070 [Cephaloticoccus sp.]|nr:hypothetical protein [Cephaloticoccus sp.]MCF7760839.1 hypothetical protein [Cephaloticoccus sp.]
MTSFLKLPFPLGVVEEILAQFGHDIGCDVAGKKCVKTPPPPVPLESLNIPAAPNFGALCHGDGVKACLHFDQQAAECLKIGANNRPALPVLFYVNLTLGVFELCDGKNFRFQ